MAIQTLGDKGNSNMSGWAALAKVGGDLASSALGLYSSSKAWRRQREAAQNAHQWEVADLRKAGLNPILSATGGSGASAGSASVPAGLGVDLGEAYKAVAANDLIKEQSKTQREQQDALRAQGSNQRAQAWLNDNLSSVASANARNINANADLTERQNEYWRNHPQEFKTFMEKQSHGQTVANISAAADFIKNGFSSWVSHGNGYSGGTD